MTWTSVSDLAVLLLPSLLLPNHTVSLLVLELCLHLLSPKLCLLFPHRHTASSSMVQRLYSWSFRSRLQMLQTCSSGSVELQMHVRLSWCQLQENRSVYFIVNLFLTLRRSFPCVSLSRQIGHQSLGSGSAPVWLCNGLASLLSVPYSFVSTIPIHRLLGGSFTFQRCEQHVVNVTSPACSSRRILVRHWRRFILAILPYGRILARGNRSTWPTGSPARRNNWTVVCSPWRWVASPQ